MPLDLLVPPEQIVRCRDLLGQPEQRDRRDLPDQPARLVLQVLLAPRALPGQLARLVAFLVVYWSISETPITEELTRW